MKELETSESIYWRINKTFLFTTTFVAPCSDCRLLATKKGFMDIDSAELRIGHRIYLLADGKYPYIQATDRRRTSALVPGNYVHALIDGVGLAELGGDKNGVGESTKVGFHDVFIQ